MKVISLLVLCFSFLCSEERSNASDKEGLAQIEMLFKKAPKDTLFLPVLQGLNYDIYEVYPVGAISNTSENGSDDFLNYEIRFPYLSKKEATKLKKHFGNYSSIATDLGSGYRLRDFLPPAIQALWGKVFIETYSHTFTLDGDKETAWRLNNCWSTAYELLRFDTSFFEGFYSNGTDIGKAFDEAGTTLKRFCFSKAKKLAEDISTFQTALLPFDALLIRSTKAPMPDLVKFDLEHAAIYIDGEVYFEKTGTGDEFFFRYVKASEIIDEFVLQLGPPESATKTRNTNFVEFKRFPRGSFVSISTLNKKIQESNYRASGTEILIEDRDEDIGGGWSCQYNSILKLPIEQDGSGRSSFNEQNLQKIKDPSQIIQNRNRDSIKTFIIHNIRATEIKGGARFAKSCNLESDSKLSVYELHEYDDTYYKALFNTNHPVPKECGWGFRTSLIKRQDFRFFPVFKNKDNAKY